MQIKFLRSGLSSSIQDRGRFGYAGCGVPESGVMDKYAAGMANLLAGNEGTAAVLEITMSGPKLHFSGTHRIVVTGLEAEVQLNNKNIPFHEPLIVEKDDVLDMGAITKGNFAYVAINGGFQTEETLSSRSMYQGITKNNRFKNRDTIQANVLREKRADAHAKIRFDIERYDKQVLTVFPGPECNIRTPDPSNFG